MTILVTILLLVAICVFLLLLGLGIAIAIGALVVGGIFLLLYFFIFGHGFVWSGMGATSQAKALPQQFNHCLMGDDLELCRTKFTVWTKDEAETIRQLAKQVKNDLGPRIADDTKASQYAQSTINGSSTVTIDEETNFTKRKSVREHYVLVQNPGDKTLKIKELNWDYGVETPGAKSIAPAP